MADITKIRNYLKKIKNVIENEIDLKIFGKNYINKKKIDDLLCCLISSLPTAYTGSSLENVYGADKYKRCRSITFFKQLNEQIRRKCLLNSNMYSVNQKEIITLVHSILFSIEKDISYIENPET